LLYLREYYIIEEQPNLLIVQETYPICLLSHGFLLGQGLEIFKGRVQPELTIN